MFHGYPLGLPPERIVILKEKVTKAIKPTCYEIELFRQMPEDEVKKKKSSIAIKMTGDNEYISWLAMTWRCITHK